MLLLWTKGGQICGQHNIQFIGQKARDGVKLWRKGRCLFLLGFGLWWLQFSLASLPSSGMCSGPGKSDMDHLIDPCATPQTQYKAS